MLDTVPGPALARAQMWERHPTEVETGLPPDSTEGATPRPEYDPRWRTLSERIAAKAAELSAADTPASNRRHRRLRRQHNDTTLEAALARARGLVHDWLEADDQPDFQQRCAQRLDELRYDPAADPYRPSQHRLELATYPEVISLAAYFISEH